MHTPDSLEVFIIRANARELITFLMDKNYILREYTCQQCGNNCSFVPYKRSKDEYSWRCMFVNCPFYKKYTSLRVNSFFEKFTTDLKTIMRILIKYASRIQRYQINIGIDISAKTIKHVIDSFTSLIAKPDFKNNKLGGPGCLVEIDETMLNYKCKSHRGRSPLNRTDSLAIVEFRNNITRAFACVIPDKTKNTLIPIICDQVATNSIIWTDELSTYKCLRQYGFNHDFVTHKYFFLNSETGVNSQAVESFNNELKLEIKKRKGVETIKRDKFLIEFCFYFNNRNDFFNACFELMKLND